MLSYDSMARMEGESFPKTLSVVKVKCADFLNRFKCAMGLGLFAPVKRSNVESTVMMIKTKHGDGLRSKTEVAGRNESLCKILCHNLCVNVSAMHELGIQPQFGIA